MLIPTSDNDLGQDLNYGKRQRLPSPDYEFYADPHSSNSGSWDDTPTDLEAFYKDLDPVDFASLQNNIPTSSANASMNVAQQHKNGRRTPPGPFSPPSPKRCSLSPEPSPHQLNSTFTRLASPPPTGADSGGPGSAGTPLSRRSSISFVPTDVWQEGVDGVMVNTQGELPGTGPSSPPFNSHGPVPSQNLMAPASESASPPQYDPALDQLQLHDAAHAPEHHTDPATQHDEHAEHEVHNEAAPIITADFISCRIWLCDIVDKVPVPRRRCNAILPRDMGALRVHFAAHQDRKELQFNMKHCPFINVTRKCSAKIPGNVDLGVFVKHVYSSQHFPDAARIPCPTCDKTFERQDAVTRHQKDAPCPPVPKPTEQASCSTQVHKKPRLH